MLGMHLIVDCFKFAVCYLEHGYAALRVLQLLLEFRFSGREPLSPPVCFGELVLEELHTMTRRAAAFERCAVQLLQVRNHLGGGRNPPMVKR